MIDKREIIDAATAVGLTPHLVEKDDVLGWLLWGIDNHRAVGDRWAFKGGTCLKKCFFETYRFSEDLDFTLDDPSHIDEDFLMSVFSESAERIYEETGIEFPPDARKFDIYENPRGWPSCQARPAAAELLDVLSQKCAFKGIDVPVFAGLEPQRPLLEGNWDQMLAHQLPTLPPFAAFWDELPVSFEWLRGGIAPSIPAAYVGAAGELTIREPTMQLPLTGRAQSHLEVIRFAASNRLCVGLRYQGSARRIEPYSLRRTTEGKIILHAHNRNKDEPRSFRVDRIEGANVTGETFSPRFAIEPTPASPSRAAKSNHVYNPLK